MSKIPAQQLIEQLNWRYAVKRFDPNRKVDDATWQAIEQALILTPSSYGLQPWKFIVITDEATKAKLPEISWNQKQPQDCSHMVILAAKVSMDAAYVDHFMNSVVTTRGLASDAMAGYRKVLVSTIEKMDQHLDWNARQVYIALGQLMLAAALLGVDTCPMEGIVAPAYDELLGLTNSGYATVVGCAVGYRHAEDMQAAAKKVRFASDAIIQRI
jgi:nitroreductase